MDHYDQFRLYRGLVQLLQHAEERTLEAIGRELIAYGQAMVAQAQAPMVEPLQLPTNGTTISTIEAELELPAGPNETAQLTPLSVPAAVPEA